MERNYAHVKINVMITPRITQQPRKKSEPQVGTEPWVRFPSGARIFFWVVELFTSDHNDFNIERNLNLSLDLLRDFSRNYIFGCDAFCDQTAEVSLKQNPVEPP